MIYHERKKGATCLHYKTKKGNIKVNFEILNNNSEHITLVQLMHTVGNLNYAVGIGVNCIFDSIYDKVLPLGK